VEQPGSSSVRTQLAKTRCVLTFVQQLYSTFCQTIESPAGPGYKPTQAPTTSVSAADLTQWYAAVMLNDFDWSGNANTRVDPQVPHIAAGKEKTIATTELNHCAAQRRLLARAETSYASIRERYEIVGVHDRRQRLFKSFSFVGPISLPLVNDDPRRRTLHVVSMRSQPRSSAVD
jgi:hypothetical protein